MKKFSIFTLALSLLFAGACTEQMLDPLTGEYQIETHTFTKVDVKESQKLSKTLKQLEFTLSNDEGESFEIKLSSTEWAPATGNYAPVSALTADKQYVGTLNAGGKTTSITEGALELTRVGTTCYITGFYNGSTKVVFRGDINFEIPALREPKYLTKVISAQSNVASGTLSVTINIGTDGITTTPNAWGGEDIAGSGNYLAIDLYSADGTLVPGTYKPCAAGGQIGEGEYGIGWDPGDLWGIGMIFENWGTCWWTVDGAEKSARKITEGNITVEKEGKNYTITYDNGSDLYLTYEGPVAALEPGSGEVSANYQGKETVTPGMADESTQISDKHTVEVSDKDGKVVATFDFYTKIGQKEIAGTYEVKGSSAEVGVAGDGWDASAWGFGMGGSIIWVDGEEYLVREGHITVEDNGGLLTIKSADDVKITLPDYATPAPVQTFCFEGITFSELGGGQGGDEVEYVELVNLLVSQDNTASGGNTVTLKLGTEGVTATTEGWNTVYSGDGYFLSLDIYSADGSVAEGTYAAAAEGGSVGEGEFGIGYDVEFWGQNMIWGSCWTTVAAGEQTSIEKIVDGTLTVAKDGSNYVITIQSTVVNARYTGPIFTEA